MASNKTYHVKYHLYGPFSDDKGIDVLAPNKIAAYDKARYEAIPAREGEHPYSAWVHSVTYANGDYKRFDTFEGKPV